MFSSRRLRQENERTTNQKHQERKTMITKERTTTNGALGETRPTRDNDRRRFLKLAGAALLAGSALPKSADASIHQVGGDIRDGTSNTFTGGVVFNSELGLVLNVYLALDADGTGVGTLSDPVHSTVNSHLAVQRTSGQGNHFHCEGVVLASNGGTPVGQPFVVDGVVHENFTALALQMNDATFLGKGFLVSAPMFAIPGLGR